MPISVKAAPPSQASASPNDFENTMKHRRRGCCGSANYQRDRRYSSGKRRLHKFCKQILKPCRAEVEELHDRLSLSVPPRFTQDIFDMTDIASPLPEVRL